MAKIDKAELKKQGEALKQVIAQARKKTLNFALLQGKDQMFLETHLKKNPTMLRKEARKAGGGPKAAMGTLNVEGKNLIFSVEEEPPGTFPKLTKKHFMTRGLPVRVTFKLPNGAIIDDGEAAEEGGGAQAPAVPQPKTPETGRSDTPTPDASIGKSIMDAFKGIQSELDEKMGKANEGARSVFQNLSDKFHASHAGELYDDAEKQLTELKSQLSDFVDEVVDGVEELGKNLLSLPPDVQKRIDAIIAAGVTESELQKKTAKENVQKLVEKVLAGVEEAKEFRDAILKPAAVKILAMLAEIEKYRAAKEKLTDMDLSKDQSDSLARLSIESPKSFAAALKALQTMDADFGDLDATPTGIAELQEKVREADTLLNVEKKKQEELSGKEANAMKAFSDAMLEQTEAQRQINKVEAAIKALRTKLPKDLKEFTPAQAAALSKVLELLKSKKASHKAIGDDVLAKDKLYKDAVKDREAQEVVTDAANTKKDGVAKVERTAGIKKQMLDSLAVGALSPDAVKPLKDEDVAKILAAVNADPEFGSTAMDLVETSKDKENVAKGAGLLADGMANEFKDGAGNPFGTPQDRAGYATSALTLGNAMGGSYFDDMNAYIDKGGMNKPTALKSGGGSYKELEQDRAKYIGNAMVGTDGKIDTKSQQATDAMDAVNFHPAALFNSTPSMNMHFADMAEKMDDPKHKQKCQDVLNGITDAPTDPAGRDLVALSVGKTANPGDVNAADVKSSVMSAMFTPLNQGPVGSCFATGPARNVRGKDPAKVMADMAQIATKGTFTTAQGLDIKAVRTNLGTTDADKAKNKLPAEDNPLMRSWEYTVATAGAQLANSVERDILDMQLWSDDKKRDPGQNNLNAVKTLVGKTKWENDVQNDLKNIILDQLVFRYNATSDIEESADGKSVNGNFEIFNKGGEVPPAGTITEKAEFIRVITALALKAADADGDAELTRKITDHCKSDKFINSICIWEKGTGSKADETRPPWELRGGGFDAPMVKVLEGGDPKTEDMVKKNPKAGKRGHETQAVRTKKVVTALIGNFVAQDPAVDMVNISTSGIHAFEGLPNHPSLAKLKDGGDPAAAIQKHLIEPGLALAAKVMEAEKVGILFDRQVGAYRESNLDRETKMKDDEKGSELLKAARAKRPDKAMTAKDLKAIIDGAIQPLIDYEAKYGTDKWKADQIDEGNTPTNKEIAEDLKKRKKWGDDAKEATFNSNVINSLGSPEFVVADSNWGDEAGHTYFVVIPDPVTGQPKMFTREEPSGALAPLDDDWLDTAWETTK